MNAPLSPEDRLAQLARAIVEENHLLAETLVSEGVPLLGKRLKGVAPSGVPQAWYDEGLPPLTWVVSRMLDLVRGNTDNAWDAGFSSALSSFAGSVQSKATTYSEEVGKSLEALSQIGGALLIAGASPEVRMGRTARSQKAIDALGAYLPEYATSMRAAAHQRLLQSLVKKRVEDSPDPTYRRRM